MLLDLIFELFKIQYSQAHKLISYVFRCNDHAGNVSRTYHSWVLPTQPSTSSIFTQTWYVSITMPFTKTTRGTANMSKTSQI